MTESPPARTSRQAYLCALVNTTTNEIWTSLWSTREAALSHLRTKFRLTAACTDDNYSEHVPVGWYVSIDLHEIDKEYRDLSEEDPSFGVCGDIGIARRREEDNAEARES